MPLSSSLLVLGRVITKPAMTCGHLASYCSPLRYGLGWRMLQVDAKEGAPLRCAHEILLQWSWFHPLQRSTVNNGFRFLFYWILIDGIKKRNYTLPNAFPRILLLICWLIWSFVLTQCKPVSRENGLFQQRKNPRMSRRRAALGRIMHNSKHAGRRDMTKKKNLKHLN